MTGMPIRTLPVAPASSGCRRCSLEQIGLLRSDAKGRPDLVCLGCAELGVAGLRVVAGPFLLAGVGAQQVMHDVPARPAGLKDADPVQSASTRRACPVLVAVSGRSRAHVRLDRHF
jgi:hypothetical protein